MTLTGRIVTFYSFKGGVGRSMALANVAWRLAGRHGLRVVVVDWDLEAPGLHRFFGLEDSASASTKCGGVLELLKDWQVAVDIGASAPPTAADYLLQVPRDDAHGRLELMFAGRLDDDFGERLQSFDLDGFYECDHGGTAIETLRKQLCERADLVLVDSRTGLNEIGGICTIQMPDGVVFMTAPNEQGFCGVSNVARAVQCAPGEERAGRPSPTSWLVVARMPVVDDPAAVKSWWEKHKPQFDADRLDGVWTPSQHPAFSGISTHSIPFVPRWSLGEPLVFKETTIGTYDPLARAYDHLAATIFSWFRPRTAELAASEATAEQELVMRLDTVNAARVRKDAPGLSIALYEYGVALRRAGRLDDAAEALAEAAGTDSSVEDKDGRAASLQALAMVRTDQGRFPEAMDSLNVATSLAEELGDPERIAAALSTKGVWNARQGRLDEAIVDLTNALTVQREHQLRRQQAVTCDLLGGLYLETGQLALAEKGYEDARQLYHAESEPRGLAAAAIGLGRVALERKEWATAVAHLSDAQDRLSQLPGMPPARLPDALHGLAQALEQLGQTKEAVAALRSAAEVSQRRKDQLNELVSWRAAARLGDPEAAARVKQLEEVGPARRWTLTLTPTELDDLSRPVVGQGGFQSLLRELQSRIQGSQLTVDESLHERMERSATRYGEGGFQRRLRELLARLKPDPGGK